MARKSGEDRGLFERPAGSGVWWVRYSDAEGREHREKVGSKGAARRVYERRKGEIRLDRFEPDRVAKKKPVLVEDLIRTHMELAQNKSWRDDQRNAKRWGEFFSGRAADSVTALEVERWKVARSKTAAKATVCRELSFLRRVFSRAVDSGILQVNPVSKVEFYKLNNARDRFLTDEEEARLATVMRARDFRLVRFAILTGMRRGEQFGAQLVDVDLDNRFLRVAESKSGEARKVLLNSEALAIAQELVAEAEALGSPWLIPSRSGKTPVCANNFAKRVFDKALGLAGIVGLNWHSLRHTYGSRLAMAGIPLRTIQLLMGHKSIRTTERYAHLLPGHTQAAVEVLASSMATGTKTGTEERVVAKVS